METDYVLYILMRTDIPSMNPGKAMAQASHASNAFVSKLNELRKLAKDNNDKRDYIPHQLEMEAHGWETSTDQGFGTVLVLGCELDDIRKIAGSVQVEQPTDLLFGSVVDPTYPYIVNHEIKDLIWGDKHTNEPHELESGDFVCFRNEVTCAYLFADKNDEYTQRLVGNLRLHA